jgi:hypothetical protein
MDEIDATQELVVGQEIWFGEFTAFARRGVVVEVTPDGVIVAEAENKNRPVPFDKRSYLNGSGTFYLETDAHYRTRHPGPVCGPESQPWLLFRD